MKRVLYLFPYTLTNAGFMLFFVSGAFLFLDSLKNPNLEGTLYLFGKLLALLLLFSTPKFLIKGAIPEPFQKGNKHGFKYITKYIGICVLFYAILISAKMTDRSPLFHQCMLWSSFAFTIYCHYFWGIWLKKAKSQS